MDQLHSSMFHHSFQASPPMKTQASTQTSIPILAIAIIGILTTAFLLVSYYIFVIKCCLNWHRVDFLRPFFISRSQPHQDPVVIYTTPPEHRGLEESLIRAIPILQFKKLGQVEEKNTHFFECAVCLNEFQEEEKLRVLPNCTHAFHIDCIDIWLQNNANCPLCRSIILPTTRFPINEIIAPSSSPYDGAPFPDTTIVGDENFVVIEVRNTDGSEEVPVPCISPSPKKLFNKKGRKFRNLSSMGDECINVRAKDDQFSVQPIRRSISMDSSADRQLYLSVQEIIQQGRHFHEVTTNEDCSSSSSSTSGSSRFRSMFSFRGGSKNAILPIQFEEQN